MIFLRQVVLGIVSIPVAWAQYSGWAQGQVNSSICTWKLPRVLALRDTVFFDGGGIWWSQGMSTGEYTQTREDNRVGVMLSLNLTRAFQTSDNLTALLDTIDKAVGAANNVAPNYVDGALLGNDAQFFMYGGMTKASSAYAPPDENDVLEYQQYHYGGEGPFEPGFVNEKLPEGVTRNVAYGAAVSVPSENKAWYFSGLRSPTHGIIYDEFSIEEGIPSNVSDTLISVAFDPIAQNLETWENTTLGADVQGRAGAEGVFVPVGPQGIIVFVGGVTHPEFASATHESENPVALNSDGKTFMSVIDIYDIATGKFYKQPTSSDAPPARAQGCAVAQPAKDYSSFNIYYYGGYSAENQIDNFSDDVWILSLPSFKWIKARSGSEDHSRAGHRCVAAYPDQMMVFGGWTPRAGTGIDCVADGIIQLLNLTSLEWMDAYDPEVYGEYGVPDVVQAEIGGSFGGGATVTTPVASGGWQDEHLSRVFETPYPTKKITTWYPYGSAPPDRTDIDVDDNHKGGLPAWVAPVLGVALGLIFVTALGVVILLWKRRKWIWRRPGEPSSEKTRRVASWVWRQQPKSDETTVTTADDMPHMADMPEARSPPPILTHPAPAVLPTEVENTEIHELPSTFSPHRSELDDRPLSYVEVIEKHTHLGVGGTPQQASSSHYSSVPTGYQTSNISHPSAEGAGASSLFSPARSRVDPFLDTVDDGSTGRAMSGMGGGSSGGSPVSPPTAGERAGEDDVAARPGPVSPIRQSYFGENLEDMPQRGW